MSGEKRRYVRVEEQHLRRLQEQDSRLRSLQRDLPERLQLIQEQARQSLQQRLGPLEQRAETAAKEAQRLKSNLRQLELETHQRLQQQQREFKQAVSDAENRSKQALQQQASRLESAMERGFVQQRLEYLELLHKQRQEYQDLFARQDQKFTSLIAEEREARLQQIAQLEANINQERQRQMKLGEDLLADVELIWQQIERDYPHQRFAPGRLADLRRGLELAKSNLQAGLSQAAISTCQNTYLDLADLRLELARKEQEWQLLYNAAITDVRSLIAEVQANRECEMEFGQGAETDRFKVELDYWTKGRLSQYESQLNQLESRLKSGVSTLTIPQLEALGKEINSRQPILGEIVQEAKLAILSSQLRVEIADRVVETLSSLGYTLVNPDADAVYEGEDQRQAFVVKVKNIAGDEVVTVISPDQEFGVNSISINTFSPTLLDEKATGQNAKAIFDILEQEGVRGQGQIECREQPRAEYRDVQQVQRRQVSNQVQEVQENV